MSAQHFSFSWLVTSVLNLSLFHFSYTVSPRTHKMDAGYLKREVGGPLRRCLAEVSEKRPYDPIEFIAHWLYKFMENKKYEEQVSLSTVVLVWPCFCFFLASILICLALVQFAVDPVWFWFRLALAQWNGPDERHLKVTCWFHIKFWKWVCK